MILMFHPIEMKIKKKKNGNERAINKRNANMKISQESSSDLIVTKWIDFCRQDFNQQKYLYWRKKNKIEVSIPETGRCEKTTIPRKKTYKKKTNDKMKEM